MNYIIHLLPKQPIETLAIPAILGAAMPFSLVLSPNKFLKSWMAKPLLLIPSEGALGGIFFFLRVLWALPEKTKNSSPPYPAPTSRCCPLAQRSPCL
jgi:hypothetical protein